MDMEEGSRVWKTIFVVYLVLLFILVVIKFQGSFQELAERIASNREYPWSANLVPFASIRTQLGHMTQWWAVKNVVGNIVCFIPWGFLMPLAYPKVQKFWRTLGIALGGILAIEIFQLLTGLGSFDVDDIILNLLGVMCGFVLWRAWQKGVGYFKRKRER